METEVIKHDEQELEEGELDDSDDGYTPLQRPGIASSSPPKVSATNVVSTSGPVVAPLHPPSHPHDTEDEEDNFSSTDSSDESDVSNKLLDGRKKKKRREIKVRPMKPVKPVGRVRPEKYNVWTATLQEDLMENMRGCDVNNHRRDREVESYDYRIKYRLNGDSEAPITGIKRRQSYSDDSDTSNRQQQYGDSKRFRAKNHAEKKISAKLRLGPRLSTEENSNDDGMPAVARHVLDLSVNAECTNEEIAQDIAMKLYEEKDDLLLHAINTIGSEIPIKLFAETQKIELDGGMMTMDGYRRRTPGGVFLFLLKHCSDITKEQKKVIFYDDKKKFEKKRKNSHETKRDQKVEQLKKSLALTSGDRERKDSLSLLNPESSNPSLSNPPPSPVTDDCQDGNDIEPSTKIVNKSETTPSVRPKQAATSTVEPNIAYDEDFLDMTCDDMDLF
ncbi:phosphorylated adapter RNA export protein [Culicoides brevitarsis]|uniref:phosphorylated adapter RNA export protein n=1 Tax=Culicoides brevitarsis TaxID=469753 RepID=UPI00307BEA31